MKTLKRVLAAFMAVLMLISFMTLTAFAEAPQPDEPAPAQPQGSEPEGYTLTENSAVEVREDATPLAVSPVENCCVLHLFLLLGALAVELFYTHDRKKRQQEEFQIRRDLT